MRNTGNKSADYRVLRARLSPRDQELALGLLYQAGLSTLITRQSREYMELQAQVPKGDSTPWIQVLRSLELRVLEKGRRIFSRLRLQGLRQGRWAKAYQAHLKPFPLFGKTRKALSEDLWIDPSGKIPRRQRADTLYIKASLAFGTGTHASTRLAARLLREAMGCSPKGRVLDMGCGTGILAMLARRWGAQRVVAVDQDPEALAVCRENLSLNRIRSVALKQNLKGERSRFAVIVANITANVLRELRPALLNHLKPGGILICSGLLYRDVADILRCYRGLRFIRRLNSKGWSALMLRRGVTRGTKKP